jgi:putative thioredoxin
MYVERVIFMDSDESTPVIELDNQNFEQEVLQRSSTAPVLVDFWAPWCGPCLVLGPILEKLANEYGGAFSLARVNTEENPELAMQFQIQSIPCVMMFKEGKVVDQFVGALPESDIRQFLDRHCPQPADKLFTLAEEIRLSGNLAEAEKLYLDALALNPSHSPSHLALAKILIFTHRQDQSITHLDAISSWDEEYEAATRLREVLNFASECQKAGNPEELRAKVKANPRDLEARFALASCLVAKGKYRRAMDEFLEIILRDKKYRDEAPRKAMLGIFILIGERSELADEYRTRLSRTLY